MKHYNYYTKSPHKKLIKSSRLVVFHKSVQFIHHLKTVTYLIHDFLYDLVV